VGFNDRLTMTDLNNQTWPACSGGRQESEMGIVIQFPVEAAMRRLDSAPKIARVEMTGDVLILPVVRIEREADETNGNSPDEGTAAGRRRRRRARS
jgi:hypothetical protein